MLPANIRPAWDTNDLDDDWSSLPSSNSHSIANSTHEETTTYSSIIIHQLSPTTKALLSEQRATDLTTATDKKKPNPLWKRSRLKDIFSPIQLETLFLPTDNNYSLQERVEPDPQENASDPCKSASNYAEKERNLCSEPGEQSFSAFAADAPLPVYHAGKVEREDQERRDEQLSKPTFNEKTSATPKNHLQRFPGFTADAPSPIYPLHAPSSPSFSYTPARVTSSVRGPMRFLPKPCPDFGLAGQPEPRLPKVLRNRQNFTKMNPLRNNASESSLVSNDEKKGRLKTNNPVTKKNESLNCNSWEISDAATQTPKSQADHGREHRNIYNLAAENSNSKIDQRLGPSHLQSCDIIATSGENSNSKINQSPASSLDPEPSETPKRSMENFHTTDHPSSPSIISQPHKTPDTGTSKSPNLVSRPSDPFSTASNASSPPISPSPRPFRATGRVSKLALQDGNESADFSHIQTGRGVSIRTSEEEARYGVAEGDRPPSAAENSRQPQEKPRMQSAMSSASSSVSAYTHPLPHDRLFQNDYDTLTRRRLTALVSQLDNELFTNIDSPREQEHESLHEEKRGGKLQMTKMNGQDESVPETKTPGGWALPVESNGISGEGTVYALASENRDKRIKLIPTSNLNPEPRRERNSSPSPSSSSSSSFQSSQFPSSSNGRTPEGPSTTSQSRRTTVTEEDMTTASVLARARMLMNTIRHQEHSRTNSVSSFSSRLGESFMNATVSQRREWSGPSISEQEEEGSVTRESRISMEAGTPILVNGGTIQGALEEKTRPGTSPDVQDTEIRSGQRSSGFSENSGRIPGKESTNSKEIVREVTLEAVVRPDAATSPPLQSGVHVLDECLIESFDTGIAHSSVPTIPLDSNNNSNKNNNNNSNSNSNNNINTDHPFSDQSSLFTKSTPSVVNNGNLNVDMTIITPLDLPRGSLPEQVGTMVYDPLNMRWIDISGEEDDSDPFGSCEDVASEGDGSFEDGRKECENQEEEHEEERALECWATENEVSELGISPRPNPVRDIEGLPFLDERYSLDGSRVREEDKEDEDEEEEGNGTLEVGQRTACLMRAFKSLEDIGPEDLLPDRTTTYLSAPVSPRGRITPISRDLKPLSPIKLKIPPVPESPVRRDTIADNELRDAELVEKRLLEDEPCRDSWPALRNIKCDALDVESVAVLEELLGKDSDCECLIVDDNRLNYLTGIPVSLVSLSVRNNCLTNLTGFGVLPNLQYLDVSGNAIDNLTGLSCLRHLRELCADNNGIVECDWLGAMTGLLRVSLRGNRIEKIDLGLCNLHSLESIDLAYNKIQTFEGLESCASLASVNLDYNQVHTIRLSRPLSNLRTLRMSHNPFPGPLDLTLFPMLRTLHADAGRLSRHAICGSKFRKLEGVSLRAHESGNLELEYKLFRMARKLYLSGNTLLSIERLQGFLNLEILELCDIGLRQLPANFSKQAPNLRSLNISQNPLLTDLLPLRKMKGLSRLRAIGCGVREPFVVAQVAGGCANLKVLDVRQNPITEKLYAPLPPPTPLERSCLEPYPPTGDKWISEDSNFVREFPRIAYRSVILAHATTMLQELDGVSVTERERRDAPCVEARLREAAKGQGRKKAVPVSEIRKKEMSGVSQLGGPGQRMQDRVLTRKGKSKGMENVGRPRDGSWLERGRTESSIVPVRDGTQDRSEEGSGGWTETKDRENSMRDGTQIQCEEGRLLEREQSNQNGRCSESEQISRTETKGRENSVPLANIGRCDDGRWSGNGPTCWRKVKENSVEVDTKTRCKNERSLRSTTIDETTGSTKRYHTSPETRNDDERHLLAKWTALRHCSGSSISVEKTRRQTLATGDQFWIPWDNDRTLGRRSKTMSPQRDHHQSLLQVSRPRCRVSSAETDNSRFSSRNEVGRDDFSSHSTAPIPTVSSPKATTTPRQEGFPPPQPPASLVPRMEEWESRRRLWHEIMGQQFLLGDGVRNKSDGKEGFYVRVMQVSDEF